MNTMKRKTPGVRSASVKDGAPDNGASPRDRTSRRKQQTRAKLLEAALRLVISKGIDGVSINDITDEADLGFGTFYNHFESKEAINTALREMLFDQLADLLDEAFSHASDPAVVIGCSVRNVILYAISEPEWGHLLLQEGYSGRGIVQHFGGRLSRDMVRGIKAGRFVTADPLISFLGIGGMVLTAISATLQGEAVLNTALGGSMSGPLRLDRLDVRVATAALVLLGIPRAEAEQIAAAPLPPLAGPSHEEVESYRRLLKNNDDKAA